MNEQSVFLPADILLAKSDLKKFSVVACDQYTSEPDYWDRVESFVGDAPSALRLILPECRLCDDNTAQIGCVNRKMAEYLNDGIFERFENAVFYVERTLSDGKTVRRGLVGCVDLECYDFRPAAGTAIRASEETVAERIPPRVKIRENAPLELPHAMLLADDENDLLLAPITAKKSEMEQVYDFDLMEKSGHLTGWRLTAEQFQSVDRTLAELQRQKNGLLFCVGDGNHSLASAKACYEAHKTPKNRYALVEIVNIHEPSLIFTPIFRVVFGADLEKIAAALEAFCPKTGETQTFTLLQGDREKTVCVPRTAVLPVATLQSFLDDYLRQNPTLKIDYIHSEQSVRSLVANGKAVGFLFEGMQKCDLFPAVLADGALPRKTFSMGEAADKRFYLEAREIL